MQTDIAKELAQAKLTYDTMAKRILSNKVILAWILKSVMSEYADIEINTIQNYIENDPEISSVSILPGKTNTGKIQGDATEDKIPGEGNIYFDIRFHAKLPKESGTADIIVNIEAQKNFHPGYSLVTRGIFYCARLLSSQAGIDFVIPKYDDIKKVVSIWVCMDAPDYMGNAITSYQLNKKDLVPGYPDKPEEYDKISLVMICLNDKCENKLEITNLLNTIFTNQKSYQEKRKKLETEFQISMNDNLGKEMDTMCNVSDYIEEKGIEKGREEGSNQQIQLFVTTLLKNNFSVDSIIDLIAQSNHITREAAEIIVKKYAAAPAER